MVNVSTSINANLGARFRSFCGISTAAAALIASCGVAHAADGSAVANAASASLDAAMPVAEGGPLLPLASKEGAASAEAATPDAQYRALFQTWKKLDAVETVAISVPSMQPVDRLLFTSSFGVRSDPFKGTAAMHAGVDIPGALGTMSGGWRIVKTMGQKITHLMPVGGFCAETAAAMTIIGATIGHVPISTTHAITGAILGVGSVKSARSVKWQVGEKIVWAWVLTIPASAMVAGISYKIVSAFTK